MFNYKRLISVSLLICLLITFVGYGYAEASDLAQINFSAENTDSNNESIKGVAIGGLVILGIWGITKLIQNRKTKNYQQQLAKGKMYVKEKEYGRAIERFNRAYDIKDTVEVEQLLYQTQDKYQQKHYKLGSDYLDEGNWELAYKEFEKVKKYGSYQDVEDKHAQAYQKLKELKLTRIAVLEFEDSSYRFDLGGKATSLFTAQLLERDPKFIEVVEREHLNKILQEQKLKDSGLVNPKTAQDIGNILGVDYLVVGKVISGSVVENKDSEWVDVYYSDEEKKKYTVQKRAYTQIFFKLLEVNNGSVVLSRRVKKEEEYKDSYYQGDSIMPPPDEKLLDEAVTKAVKVFVDEVYNEFEIK